MKRWLATLAMVVGCGGDDGNNNKTPDAATAIDAPVDAKPLGNAMSHTLYVNADGVMVTAGADDATMNRSSLVQASSTVGPYLAGAANRTTELAAIVADVGTVLAPFAVTVTTTRPAAGPYDEVVVTDDAPTKLGAGFQSVASIIPNACNKTPSVVGFLFPKVETDAAKQHRFAVNQLIAMFANLNGVPSSQTPGDCMCWVAQPCYAMQDTQICTIGGAGTMVDQGNGGAEACGSVDATMDEHAKLVAAFGAH